MRRLNTPILFVLLFAALSLNWKNPELSKAKGAPFFKMNLSGKVLFVSEYQKGIRVFDITDVTSPRSVSFLSIAGNADIATTGNVLFVDSFKDLLIYDFSSQFRLVPIDTIKDVFANYNFQKIYPSSEESNSIGGLAGCEGCTKTDAISGPAASQSAPSVEENMIASSIDGTSGYIHAPFMSRFAIVQHYLYCADNSELVIFDIANPKAPRFISRIKIGFGIEMMSMEDNLLFIGRSGGKSIFSLDDPKNPILVASMTDAGSIDPVACENGIAYISASDVMMNAGRIDIVKVRPSSNPEALGTMAIGTAFGLTVSEKKAFIALGAEGVKIIDASQPSQVSEVGKIYGVNVFDIIKRENTLFTVGQMGIYIFDCTDLRDPIRIGTIKNKM